MSLRHWPLAFSIGVGVVFAIPVALLATGAMSLVEYELVVAPTFARPGLLASSRPPAEHAPDATAILHRNPFDSVTGALDLPPEPEPTIVPSLVDPLAAPTCETLSVYSTLESTDPYWSSAVIQGDHDPHGLVRRPGDQVDGRQVVFIGYNPRLRSPAVWFLSAGQLCQSLLFDGKPRRDAAPAPKKAPGKPPPKTKGRAPLPEALAKKIVRRSDTEFDIDRSAVDAILGDYASLMRGTRMRPVKVDGKLVGLRLSGIRADSLLGRLGWRDGDQVQSINGFLLTSPDKALEAYARLRTADHLVVRVVRGGKTLNLDYRIR